MLYKQKDYEKAKEMLEKALEIDRYSKHRKEIEKLLTEIKEY